MTPEEELREEAVAYKTFLANGGTKGSPAGRARRRRLSDLMVKVKDERFRNERITEDDEVEAMKGIDVFGE